MDQFWRRGMRLLTRIAIAFGLSTATAIFLGAAVTDNGFVQIVITAIAAVAFWLPFLFLIVGIEKLFGSAMSGRVASDARAVGSNAGRDSWIRLLRIAPPAERRRLEAIGRSLERSRDSFRRADMDPDAHELCVLIDRRLPELIESEIDNLPPDDLGRRRQISELVGLVEQFARHCSQSRAASGNPGFQAQVLRRRFEERIGEQQLHLSPRAPNRQK